MAPWFSFNMNKFFKGLSCAPEAVANVEAPVALKLAEAPKPLESITEPEVLEERGLQQEEHEELPLVEEPSAYKPTQANIATLITPVMLMALYVYFMSIMPGAII